VTPTIEGVVKAGIVKSLDEQIKFALNRLAESAPSGSRPFVMVQYTDNRGLVENAIMAELRRRYPAAELMLRPLSLTTGVHVGPGAWSLAFLPEK
jgi:uncharacterized protein